VETVQKNPEKKVLMMFQDEAGFGRISEPTRCWAPLGIRPVVPSQRVREYVQLYGAAAPETGDSFFLILPRANTQCMNIYLDELSKAFSEHMILLVLDGASYHGSNDLVVPKNIVLFYLPPATPEMNPAEQLWKEIRKLGFKNESFASISEVVDRLCETVVSLTKNTIMSITGREWILSMF
jgi:putative transposase